MNAAHLHLIVNHLPIVGYVIGALLIACTLAKRGDRGMFLASVLVLMFAGGGALAAYFTGEPAEEIAEELNDVPEVLIERHEDAAKVATLLAAIVTGLTIVVGFIALRREGPITTVPMVMLLVAALVVCTAMTWVGNAGGKIRHSEIRGPVSAT
jgi:archaellum biogenesis protein FlaJ (TadC family)